MKKLIGISSSIAYLSLASSAFAQTTVNTCDKSGSFSVLCGLTAGNLGGVVGSLVQLVFAMAVIVALFYLIYGGFRWLVSSGDKAQVAAAREHIVAAIIGLVIIFLSYFVLNLMLGFFGVGDLSHIVIPKIKLTN